MWIKNFPREKLIYDLLAYSLATLIEDEKPKAGMGTRQRHSPNPD